MSLDIEALRAWIKEQAPGSRQEIADASGVPIDTLNKFAQGQVTCPQWRNLKALLQYKDKVEKAA